jgi:hypothetical protein
MSNLRIILALFSWTSFLYGVCTDLGSMYRGQEWKFFIYLTNWGLLLLNILLALEVFKDRCKRVSFRSQVQQTEVKLNLCFNHFFGPFRYFQNFLRVVLSLPNKASSIPCCNFLRQIYGIFERLIFYSSPNF